MSTDPGRTAGHVYADLVTAQLAEERSAKESLEKRATSAITWAGALVAASLGLLATLGENPVAAVVVFGAAVLLAISAWLGTRAITPSDYQEAEIAKLRDVIANGEVMAAGEQIALRRVADQALDILDSARAANKTKAERLRWQLRLLAAGSAGLALAVGAVAVGIVCAAYAT